MLLNKINTNITKVNTKAKIKTKAKTANTSKANKLVLSPNHIVLLILCQCLNLLTLSLELSWWMLSIITICLTWQLLIHKKLTQQPSKLLTGALSIMGCLLLVVTSQSLGLLSSMLHLLCLSYVLKSFEQNKRSDFYQIILLGLFVVVASLIFQQSLYFAIVLSIIIIINFTLIIGYFAPTKRYIDTANLSVKMFLQSAPIAIFLFFVFPKISPLWEVPVAKSAKTGLSDSVKVGDIAQLALSDELAFRVKFEQRPPAYSQMYWRTIVMENFNGREWQTGLNTNLVHTYKFNLAQANGKQLNYQVIASPTYQNWLFGLDLARIDPYKTQGDHIIHRQDYSLYSKKPITQNISYYVTSYIESPLALNISPFSYRKNLAIPKASNPKLVAKAKALREEHTNDEALINAVLSTFNQDNYHYTLKPPPLINNSLDQFYFETKSGFCEHFASSFTFLMRAAGIPSRLVTGYMGGEYNTQGEYYSIYQRDAHAWSEVWLKDKGWVRVDPTAAINPERVEKGFSEQLLQEQADNAQNAFSLLRYSNNNAFINSIRMSIEAIDYNWTRWVIGYTADKQNQFLARIVMAFESLKSINWLTLLYYALLLISTIILWWMVRKLNAARKPKTISYYYQHIIERLQKHGVEKPHEITPQAFTLIIKEKLPNIAFEFAKFTQLYTALQYQSLAAEQQKNTIKAYKQSYKRMQQKLR